MPNQISLQTLLQAIKSLHIDVPIMRTEEDADGSIIIYLYGGAVRHWPPTASATIAIEADGIRPARESSPTPSKKPGRPKKEQS